MDKATFDHYYAKVSPLKEEIAKSIVGQEKVVEGLLLSMFAKGHALLMGVPGLAKTLMVNTLGQVMGVDSNRVQFTPDLMPSDITGSEVLNKNREFEFIPGPIFTNILLADEINRTPPKTQAALLEAMQEKHVTNGGKQMDLPNPFFVLATQNPIEQEGTYPLPEAQLDRFMFLLKVDYPTFDQELAIVKATTGGKLEMGSSVLSASDILAIQDLVRAIPVADNVIQYAVELVRKTRSDSSEEITKKFLSWGAGPRASQYLILGAKAHAFMNGKYTPDIEDVQAVAEWVLAHRIVLNYKGVAEGVTEEDIIRQIL